MTTIPTRRWGWLIAALLFAAGSAGAAPQKIFRCGPDGRIYSQTPCKDGDGYEVHADDKRAAEQRKDAEDAVRREGQLAEKMRRERLAQEAAAAKPVVRTVVKPAPVKPAASSVAAKKKRAAKKPDQD